MPYVLHPHVCAGGEEKPMHWYEYVADHVGRERHQEEKQGERLSSKDTNVLMITNVLVLVCVPLNSV